MPNPFLGLGFNSWSTKYSRGSAGSIPIPITRFAVGSYGDDDNSASNSGSVYLYDLDGTNELKITAPDAAASDRFHIVAMSTQYNKLIVGAPGDDSYAGSAYVFDLNGTYIQKITPSDGSNSFGQSVAIGSNKIVIGATGDDDGGSAAGAVYIYNLDGTNETKITASDATLFEWFGTSVAVGHNKFVVGALIGDPNDAGAAYVYNLDGTNEIKLTGGDSSPSGDAYGQSVAIGNNKIVVGCPASDENGSNSGSVYVYNLDGTGEVTITASDAYGNAEFGTSVAVAHNKIFVGAPSSSTNNAGAVYIYNLDGTNEVKITPSDDNPVDGIPNRRRFGQSISVAENKIIVGADGYKFGVANVGSVYIYNLDGTNEINLLPSDIAAGDQFGASVSIG